MLASGQTLARGVAWSFLGQCVPIAIALLAIPALIDGYGTARFGLLALVWVAIGYFGLFDLGMSRALTQLVAQKSHQSDRDDVASTVWTALAMIGGLGLVGGGILAIFTPILIETFLKMPPALVDEARTSFLLVAVCVPLLTISLGFRGILEAHLKFKIVNAVMIPLASMTLLGPVLLLAFSDSLVPAVCAVILARVAGGAFYLWFSLKVAPEMRRGIRLSATAVVPLLRFGSWMTISNIVGPIMVIFDRFVIGSVASVTATAYYSAPYDLVTRLWIVPSSLAGVLFPAFATASSREPSRVSQLYASGVKYTFVVLVPLIFVVAVFAEEILDIWLGPDFSRESTRVLQILALGVLANSLAHIPFALVQGLGRADITAKFHLAELPFYLALLWWGVSNFGIEGAAIAWSVRVVADMVLLFMAARRLTGCSAMLFRRAAVGLAFACIVSVAVASVGSVAIKIALSVAIVAIFLSLSWYFLLSIEERQFLLSRSARAAGKA